MQIKSIVVSTKPALIQVNPEVETLKKLLGRGWSVKLEKVTGKSRAYISDVVNNLRTESPIWDKILELAEKNQVTTNKNNRKLSRLLKKVG
jgi:hypothetical protein